MCLHELPNKDPDLHDPRARSRSVNVQEPVLLLPKGVLDTLHHRQHLLLLQPPPYDLDPHRQAVHVIGIVELVGAPRDAVQLPDVEAFRQTVEGLVDVGDGQDPGGVVELVCRYGCQSSV